MNIYAILDGNMKLEGGALSEGAICSLIAILLVFAILLVIIGITALVFKLLDMFEARKGGEKPVASKETSGEVDLNDETVMAAILTASIEYQNEIKKNVKLVSVKEVK